MLKFEKISEKIYPFVVEMLEEWGQGKTKDDQDLTPWSIFCVDYNNKQNYIESLNHADDLNLPQSTYFLYDSTTRNMIGAANIRHVLTDTSNNESGHIGYGIRPSFRGRGYGTILLSYALKKCRSLHINQILIICEDENIASKKIIEHNGGVFEKNFIASDGVLCKRYWIQIEENS